MRDYESNTFFPVCSSEVFIFALILRLHISMQPLSCIYGHAIPNGLSHCYVHTLPFCRWRWSLLACAMIMMILMIAASFYARCFFQFPSRFQHWRWFWWRNCENCIKHATATFDWPLKCIVGARLIENSMCLHRLAVLLRCHLSAIWYDYFPQFDHSSDFVVVWICVRSVTPAQNGHFKLFLIRCFVFQFVQVARQSL